MTWLCPICKVVYDRKAVNAHKRKHIREIKPRLKLFSTPDYWPWLMNRFRFGLVAWDPNRGCHETGSSPVVPMPEPAEEPTRYWAGLEGDDQEVA